MVVPCFFAIQRLTYKTPLSDGFYGLKNECEENHPNMKKVNKTKGAIKQIRMADKIVIIMT